jgi:hypothetical protein
MRADPCGARRPCSQLRIVPTGTPMRRANAASQGLLQQLTIRDHGRTFRALA